MDQNDEVCDGVKLSCLLLLYLFSAVESEMSLDFIYLRMSTKMMGYHFWIKARQRWFWFLPVVNIALCECLCGCVCVFLCGYGI